MIEELIIDAEDQMNTDILSLRKKSGEFEERLGYPEKVLNLSPLLLT
jgi:hypothetical protein